MKSGMLQQAQAQANYVAGSHATPLSKVRVVRYFFAA